MKHQLTPKQVGQALGVSEASVKRWCDQGKIAFLRTAGGHRRITADGVAAYLRRSGQPLVRPEVLGLPPASGRGERGIKKASRALKEALEAGDGEQAHGLVANLYLAGHSCVEICDQCMTPVFHSVGDSWECGDMEVYQERRACQIAIGVLHKLSQLVGPPEPSAPLAVGGTLEHDPYSLPTAMVELILQETGWKAQSYGTNLPARTLAAALESDRPKVFWLSVSALDSGEGFLRDYQALYDVSSRLDIDVVVGGRALTEDLRREMSYATFCDTLRHLTSFAATLRRTPQELRAVAEGNDQQAG